MIFVHDRGRLCNNILQYGHLYAWGREHGRTTMSMRFAYKYPEFHISHTRYHHPWVYLLAKLAAKCRLMPTVRFNDINVDTTAQQQVMLNRPMVMATGWCVRFPDLFEKYKADIVRLFAFSDEVERAVQARLAPRTDRSLRLGVHIRRGDYATWCGGRYYYTDPQYQQVVHQFLGLFADRDVDLYVCGNDPQLDRQSWQQTLATATDGTGGLRSVRLHFPDGSAAEDLCLLSHCDYLTGAPSTFTLVAGMYHDTPLYWIVDPQKPLSVSAFSTFNHLFRQFDDLYVTA